MAPEIVASLFQPFVQADKKLDRRKGGLGLGLALVKGIVELHGGEITARSDGLGSGAEFLVRLPPEAEQLVEEPSPNKPLEFQERAEAVGVQAMPANPSVTDRFRTYLVRRLAIRQLFTVKDLAALWAACTATIYCGTKRKGSMKNIHVR